MTDRKKLESLIIHEVAFEQLEQLLKKFCPFEAMGTVRAEIRHSNFIAYILDPLRPHGFGDKVLRAVLREVASSVDSSQIQTSPPISALDIHLMDLDGADIRREWRSIDLLIALPVEQVVFVFELKIDSSQHSKQLKKYRETIEKEYPSWRKVFLFLRPSDESPEDEGWISIGYEQIVDVFEKIAKEPGSDPLAGNMLSAYSAMMRREFLGDEKLETLAAELWKKHKEVLSFLSERQPDEIGEFISKITEAEKAKQIAQIASLPRLTLIPDQHTANMARFRIKEWHELIGGDTSSGWTASKSVFLVEITRSTRKNGSVIKVGLVLGPSDSPMRQRWFNAILPMITTNSAKKPIEGKRHRWVDQTRLLSEGDLVDGFDHDVVLKKLEKALCAFVESRLIKFGEIIKAASDL